MKSALRGLKVFLMKQMDIDRVDLKEMTTFDFEEKCDQFAKKYLRLNSSDITAMMKIFLEFESPAIESYLQSKGSKSTSTASTALCSPNPKQAQPLCLKERQPPANFNYFHRSMLHSLQRTKDYCAFTKFVKRHINLILGPKINMLSECRHKSLMALLTWVK